MFKCLIGYVKVSRPPLLLMGFLGPVACLRWIDKTFIEGLLLIATIFFGNWAWNLFNEYHDVEVDRTNKPWKVLPSGKINIKNVFIMFLILLCSSFIANSILMLITSNIFYLVGFLAHFTSFVYNGWRRDLIGNMCEAATIGLAPLMVMFTENLFFPFSLASLFFGIALITQHQDLKAEKTKNIVTAPQQLGRKGTGVTSLFSLLIAITVLAWHSFTFYFFFMSGLSNIFCSIIILFNNKHEAHIIEWFSRKFGRMFILLGFISMFLQLKP